MHCTYGYTRDKVAIEGLIDVDKIKSSIEADRKHSASSSYTKVLGECISCHNKLRKWK